jgi:hypothetical protein
MREENIKINIQEELDYLKAQGYLSDERPQEEGE